MASQGVIRPLEFGGLILLRPELINNYASAVIACARKHIDEIGSVPYKDVLEAKIPFPQGMDRLKSGDEEEKLLKDMVEMFVKRSIAIREKTEDGKINLVFPSHFTRDREVPDLPSTVFTYSFEGVLDEIYATLVVRLHHVNGYEKSELWRRCCRF